MPIYLYQNPSNEKEIIEVVQSVNDVHEYVKDNIKWNRIFTVPNMAIDTVVDPNSSKDYLKSTNNKNETVGSLMDRSKELSEKRAAKNGGVDPVKEKYYEQYSKERKGLTHPDVKKRKLKEKLKGSAFSVED